LSRNKIAAESIYHETEGRTGQHLQPSEFHSVDFRPTQSSAADSDWPYSPTNTQQHTDTILNK